MNEFCFTEVSGSNLHVVDLERWFMCDASKVYLLPQKGDNERLPDASQVWTNI